ncbi:dihydromonapterin reductase [Rheinheimera riviphila]|uniref:Dihydromonapterin reductase n=1 Tax=Rheinheimera riviphila TaxID=1834037 RepID=A0A437R134_9GAMM|nr:dihydromonapterin reductase [Rheinheimera riviphila]RVU40450.1 dihydromonapterin reductase [Rheinheimera riviphila]
MRDTLLITGAAQRVGLFCALALQQQGYQVIISYRTRHAAVAELEAAGVMCLQADLTDLSSLSSFIDEVKRHCLKLRAIIHNASAWQKDLPLIATDGLTTLAQLQQDATVFDAMSHIHARAAYLLNRALLPLLQAYVSDLDQSQQDSEMPCKMADIIHLTDFVATVGSEKHQAYAASKAAVENLTFSLARQLAPTIKVNAIAPALLMFNQGDDDSYRQKALAKSLLGVAPGADEVLATINYLLQSRYITGRVLPLDGGRQLRLP